MKGIKEINKNADIMYGNNMEDNDNYTISIIGAKVNDTK